MLAEMHLAKARADKEAARHALEKWLRQGEDTEDDKKQTWNPLHILLERFFGETCGSRGHEFCKVTFSKRGLSTLVDMMLTVHVPVEIRALAVSVASKALDTLRSSDITAHTVPEIGSRLVLV